MFIQKAKFSLFTIALCLSPMLAQADSLYFRQHLPVDINETQGLALNGEITTAFSASINLQGKRVLLSDGTELTSGQIERITALQNAGRTDLIGFRVESSTNFRKDINSNSSTFANAEYYTIEPLPFEMPAELQISGTGWSDSDYTWFVVDFRNRDDAGSISLHHRAVEQTLDFPWGTGSASNYTIGPRTFIYPHTALPDRNEIYFYATCVKRSGSRCSNEVYQMVVELNPDLPKIGDTITIFSR